MPSAKEFLTALWGDQEGVAELARGTPDQKNRSKMPDFAGRPYQYPAQLDNFISDSETHNAAGKNVYYGVCLRAKPWEGGRGKADNALSTTAVWIDVDFKTVPQEKIITSLKEFSLRPSLGMMSGGGVQSLWLLREPVTGDGLRIIPVINDALSWFFGGDSVGDLARVLRIPGSINHKYVPPVQSRIVCWRPELRYNLSDFDLLAPISKLHPPAVVGGPPPGPGTDLPEDLHKKIVGLLTEIWVPGYRRKMSLYFAGVLAHGGYHEAAALRVIHDVTAAAHDEEADTRPRQVTDTYAKYLSSKAVGGAPTLEKMIREKFPPLINEKAQKMFGLVRDSLRKHKEKKERETDANFKPTKIVKFDSRPASYRVTLGMLDGSEVTVVSETTIFFYFKMFRVAAWEQANVVLSATQRQWEGLVSDVTLEVEDAPKEASPNGSMESALEEFFEERKESADSGVLKSVPGYDEAGIYFRGNAFRGFLRERGVMVEPHALARFLKDAGCESKSKRLGPKVARVWVKSLNGDDKKSSLYTSSASLFLNSQTHDK